MTDPQPYQVMTPLGTLFAHFPEEGPASIDGSEAAQQFLADALRHHINRDGASLTLANMQPIDLESCFDDGGAAGVFVLEPLERSLQKLKEAEN